ncbi:MAG: acylphosphatase [Chloroflexi bacterium]|nr:MAG: acylphosphatase [Chloroflexota bacterium]MBA4376280.1 acylphosphatase [Anaerolinea sp.]
MNNNSLLPENKQIHLFIDGRVQEVGFRYFVYDFAQQNGLSGWVRNRSNGQVEVLAEGSTEALTNLLNLVKQGPSSSVVTEIKFEWSDAERRYSQFSMLVTE